jgi:hypothetical protein
VTNGATTPVRLWGTVKAAQRWIAKNPPEAYRDIIRVWGVLNPYRPPGQTSWSKALVRHGADPRMALAAVLGVAADDILVRESPQPAAPATAPSPRPTSDPNPNTEVATQPSNVAPSSPSGDN